MSAIDGVRLGRIVQISETGDVLVDFPGNPGGPVSARKTASFQATADNVRTLLGREVLLVFQNNNPSLPVILDLMHSLIDEIARAESKDEDSPKVSELAIDGERLTLEGKQEIVLTCGKASITLTKAGKVLIKGEYVLSHSSGENRLRGGSVSIN